MTDPVSDRQLRELNEVELCTRVLVNARNELYLNMRYLDLALSSLGYECDASCKSLGTDGFVIYYDPHALTGLYNKGRVAVNHIYLHLVFHCLFSHMDTRGTRDEGLWGLSCDIAVESMIDGLYERCVHIPPTALRRDWYSRLSKELRVLNAEGIYRVLSDMDLDGRMLECLKGEFSTDDHSYWDLPQDRPQMTALRQSEWNDNRDKLQTELESMGDLRGEGGNTILEQLEVQNRERYDYKSFLRKFRVMREEIQVDPDSFDPIFYTFGLSMYKNLPLIEPLETKEVNRIEEFVIAVDTSMSCSGELVRRFLEETYDVLSEDDSFFKKTRIHIIQCDEAVRQDSVIGSAEDMERYMRDFTLIGQGGTDFRPVFDYVNGMVNRGEFRQLKGLIYFTDGEGIFPVKCPVYDVAFVFVKDQYTDIAVPPWAIKLILEPGQIMEDAGAGTAVKEHHFLEAFDEELFGSEIEHNEF